MKKKEQEILKNQKIVPIEIEDEMRTSYLNYAMSVIVGRALPDVRDGLKPVHRRILYAMRDLGLENSRTYKKSARIVGEILGKYHPHGDTAVYDTLVRMTQDFSMRYPLVDGQGNFGSVDGDSAAAMRYCVTGETLTVTDKGLVPIKELSKGGLEDISTRVLSANRQVNIAEKWFDSGEHPTLKITTSRGYSIRGTSNHPILTWTKGVLGKPEFRWKLLEQLSEGDVAVLDRTSDLLWPESRLDLRLYHPEIGRRRLEKKTLPRELNEDLAFIMGALTSEGTVKEREIEFCNTDTVWLREFDVKWNSVFPDCRLHAFRRNPNSYGNKPYFTREIHSTHVIEFLHAIGLLPVKSAKKTVPHTVLKSPRHVAAAFLKAYFEGDGSISRSGKKMVELSCCSISKQLIAEIQTLLLRFGIVATRRFDRHRNTHKLYIKGLENYRLFYKYIGFVSHRKNLVLSEVLDSYHKAYSVTDYVPYIAEYLRGHLDESQKFSNRREFVLKNNFDRYNNLKEHLPHVVAVAEPETRSVALDLFQNLLYTRYLFDPIVKIKQCQAARVYSLRVKSNCHSFVANGFVNHNTEARLEKIASSLLGDIDKDTVDFGPNFDETLEEPKLLPATLPNLLVNGAGGIAVGMATNIPPHNLNEVCEAILNVIEDPEVSIRDLMKHIKGPDFPTGASIIGASGIKSAYETGRGSLTIRATANIEEYKGGREAIIVTEIPYQVNKATLIESIANLVNNKRIDGIADIRDESDRKGMRIVIILKRDVASQVILNQLFKHTNLQTTFGVIMLALAEGRPRVMKLNEILNHYIQHRKEVVIRRTRFELEKAKDRAHILEGLKVALDNLDRIIKTIRKSKSPQIAKDALMDNFDLSERQSQAILEMQLQRLTALERDKIENEYKELLKRIEELELILRSEKRVLAIIKAEIKELQAKYGDERRTKILRDASSLDMDIEDLIADEDVVVTISHQAYVKRSPLTSYRKQRRGGMGVAGSSSKIDEDFIEHLFIASTHDHLILFTSKGKAYSVRVHELPQGSKTSKGKYIKNFVSLNQGEVINSIIPIRKFEPDKHLVMVTRSGVTKKVELSQFDNIRRSGIAAVNLHKGDELISVRLTGGKDNIFIATKSGKALQFKEKDLRSMGRAAAGVRGIRLAGNDAVIGMEAVDKKDSILTVTDKGFAKRTEAQEYRLQSRGGKGIVNIKVTAKNGPALGMRRVSNHDELMVMSTKGMVVRVAVKDIRETGRSAQGVRVINLKPGDHVATMTCIEAEESIAEEASPAASSEKK